MSVLIETIQHASDRSILRYVRVCVCVPAGVKAEVWGNSNKRVSLKCRMGSQRIRVFCDPSRSRAVNREFLSNHTVIHKSTSPQTLTHTMTHFPPEFFYIMCLTNLLLNHYLLFIHFPFRKDTHTHAHADTNTHK